MKLNLSFNSLGTFQPNKDQPPLDSATLYDLLVIGAGPAGLNAALYASRKGLQVGLLSSRRGGQVVDTSSVDNYLGIEGVTGEELADKFMAHLAKYKVPFQTEAQVVDYARQGKIHQIMLASGETYRSKTLIVATGSSPRRLGVPGEETYAGKGVAYCAICDAPLFKGKAVFVAGGGNSAVEAALDLAKHAKTVNLVHRSQLRADRILVEQLRQHPKITVQLETRILAIVGEQAMTGLQVADAATGEQRILPGDGIFVEIGHLPNTNPFHKLLQLNAQGEIITSARKETNLPGVFAAGDVTDTPYKQIIIAASDGAIAALTASDYVNQTTFS